MTRVYIRRKEAGLWADHPLLEYLDRTRGLLHDGEFRLFPRWTFRQPVREWLEDLGVSDWELWGGDGGTVDGATAWTLWVEFSDPNHAMLFKLAWV